MDFKYTYKNKPKKMYKQLEDLLEDREKYVIEEFEKWKNEKLLAKNEII